MLRSSWSAWLTLLPYTLRYMNILFVHTAQAGVQFNSSIAALSAWPKDADTGSALGFRLRLGLAIHRGQRASGRGGTELGDLSTERVAAVLPSLRAALPRARFIAGGAHPTYPTETLAEWTLTPSVQAREAWPLGVARGSRRTVRTSCGAALLDAIQRPRVTDIDGLPDWDRALFGDVTNAGNRYEQAVGVAISRASAPSPAPSAESMGTGDYTVSPLQRYVRSVDRTILEMQRAMQSVSVEHGFATWDAIFPLDRRWVSAFAPRTPRR